MGEQDKTRSSFTEEIEIAGAELVERVNKIVAEGKVSRLRIKAKDGDIYLDTPLSIGAITGGAVVLAAPWLAVLGVVAALMAKVKVEITRVEEEAPPKVDKEDKAA
jgi:hypothetical protein